MVVLPAEDVDEVEVGDEVDCLEGEGGYILVKDGTTQPFSGKGNSGMKKKGFPEKGFS